MKTLLSPHAARLTATILLALQLLATPSGEAKGADSQTPARLSPLAEKLVREAYAGFGDQPPLDHHAHILGTGEGHWGNWVNPTMRSPRHPIPYGKFLIYARSSGISRMDRAESQYLARLLALIGGLPLPGTFALLAFDHHYLPDGTIDRQRTEFYVDNAYVFALAEQHPQLFVPVMSVHPYRPDALAELERWAAKGGRMVKWLPNAMGIDPADRRCLPFYHKMRELNLTLLTHGGDEMAVESGTNQELGDPERLRLPLDQGVRVIVAHCASLGGKLVVENGRKVEKSYFEIFVEMLGEPRYDGLLYGDISALTQANRARHTLPRILEDTSLQRRLVNGSDYPLPAVPALTSTRKLQRLGLLSADERRALDEIRRHNPLLFDFVLKRTLHAPGSGRRLAPQIFRALPGLVGEGSTS